MLVTGRNRGIRPVAIGAVVAVIWGWGVAQHPFLLPGSLTIDQAAGAGSALTAVIIVFGFALAIVGPALAFLYWLSQQQALE
jgi:cytochrome d ubiquinol oxidase subunit II